MSALIFISFSFFNSLWFLDMALSGPQMPNRVYIIIRLKMSESINGISGSLFCHYGETDAAFLIGGLVEPNETMMASAIRHILSTINLLLPQA